ncbi:NAD-dependent epimerase/dehydratase family protein [Arthrobacter sp.]|uniref:NAD-dependent epimerase/dehydratase family protein n=1 Tax=Arthrobacter sp. TaxID=1667 RepID=UPI003A92FC04
MAQQYLVTGSGPVGTTIALQLAGDGHQVTLATRSGSGPTHPLITRVRLDATDPAAVQSAIFGASAVFHCIHAAYTVQAWRATLPRAEEVVLAAAGVQGIPVVFPESLYSYSRPDQIMHEGSPRTAAGGKRGIRAELLAARAASSTPTVSMVASDFYGPHAETAHAGSRMLEAVFAGRRLYAFGNPRLPHSFTYAPDLAAAMIRAADLPETWNRVLHAPTAPPSTQEGMAAAYARAAGLQAPKITGIPSPLLRALGLVHSGSRELAEMAYQFDKPFVMDSSDSEAVLGLLPTPLEEGAASTVAWWTRQRALQQA